MHTTTMTWSLNVVKHGQIDFHIIYTLSTLDSNINNLKCSSNWFMSMDAYLRLQIDFVYYVNYMFE